MSVSSTGRTVNGVVISAGKMMKCVKVRVAKQTWNKRIQKYFATPYNILVSDPTNACREGDVVSVSPGWRVSKNVRHVVNQIISPFGPPLSERPSVLTEEERVAARTKKREEKDLRQASRGRIAAAVRVRERLRQANAEQNMKRVKKSPEKASVEQSENGAET